MWLSGSLRAHAEQLAAATYLNKLTIPADPPQWGYIKLLRVTGLWIERGQKVEFEFEGELRWEVRCLVDPAASAWGSRYCIVAQVGQIHLGELGFRTTGTG